MSLSVWAGLAGSVATRQIKKAMAPKWRRLAKLAAERKSHGSPGIQPIDVFGKPS